jgi:hypothetical protein
MLTNNLFSGIALEPLCPCIPLSYVPIGVEREDGVIGCRLDEQAQLIGFARMRYRRLGFIGFSVAIEEPR